MSKQKMVPVVTQVVYSPSDHQIHQGLFGALLLEDLHDLRDWKVGLLVFVPRVAEDLRRVVQDFAVHLVEHLHLAGENGKWNSTNMDFY